ncbi:MAG: nucleotidyltransferase domain-containing protein [Candidatus Lokiarchaeota archaeon]|nr:nucleotidyltransferase domain-containing protein [Candidatus Lokiarchaeota archaeon]
MNAFNYLNKIRKDLAKLKNYQVVIYGSFLSKYYIPYKSDIDIAIITQHQNKIKNITIWKDTFGVFNEKYDIKMFELLPLYLKIEVIKNYQVLFGDALEISEYFYHYRSIWKDMSVRIKTNRFKTISEKMELIEKRADAL